MMDRACFAAASPAELFLADDGQKVMRIASSLLLFLPIESEREVITRYYLTLNVEIVSPINLRISYLSLQCNQTGKNFELNYDFVTAFG